MFNGKFRPDRLWLVDNLFNKPFKTKPLLTIYEKDVNIDDHQFTKKITILKLKTLKIGKNLLPNL